MWLLGSLKRHNCNFLAIFWMWYFIGMMPAIASMSSDGEVLKAPKIQMAALFCILLRIFMWYNTGALL